MENELLAGLIFCGLLCAAPLLLLVAYAILIRLLTK